MDRWIDDRYIGRQIDRQTGKLDSYIRRKVRPQLGKIKAVYFSVEGRQEQYV